MRHCAVIFALLMTSACGVNGTSDTPKSFQTFKAAFGDSYYCEFYEAGYDADAVAADDLDYIFVTLIGQSQADAKVRFGNETLRLIPKAGPSLKDTPEATFINSRVDLDFTVLEYSQFTVSLGLVPTGTGLNTVNYEGQVTMSGLNVTADIFGSCGV